MKYKLNCKKRKVDIVNGIYFFDNERLSVLVGIFVLQTYQTNIPWFSLTLNICPKLRTKQNRI